MGASLGPVLANIIMTELERAVVDDLITNGTLKFYARYVDDTLLMVKPDEVDAVLQKFNQFHPNLEFTVDRFENSIPHFLDLEIHRTGISIYRKETHTAQFTHFNSFTKWGHKIAWIRLLVNWASKLCHPSKLKEEIGNIKRFASYNGFPKWVVRGVVRRALQPIRPNQEEKTRTRKCHLLLFPLHWGPGGSSHQEVYEATGEVDEEGEECHLQSVSGNHEVGILHIQQR